MSSVEEWPCSPPRGGCGLCLPNGMGNSAGVNGRSNGDAEYLTVYIYSVHLIFGQSMLSLFSIESSIPSDRVLLGPVKSLNSYIALFRETISGSCHCSHFSASVIFLGDGNIVVSDIYHGFSAYPLSLWRYTHTQLIVYINRLSFHLDPIGSISCDETRHPHSKKRRKIQSGHLLQQTCSSTCTTSKSPKPPVEMDDFHQR